MADKPKPVAAWAEWTRKKGATRWHWVKTADLQAVHTSCGIALPPHDVEVLHELPAPPFEYCSRCYTSYAKSGFPKALSGEGCLMYVALIVVLMLTVI